VSFLPEFVHGELGTEFLIFYEHSEVKYLVTHDRWISPAAGANKKRNGRAFR
jgi:hypothetical protein